MGVSFKREDTMRFFQEIAFLLLPHLVVGQLLDLNRDEPIMDTSEKWECYVFGQCEEYSVNFEDINSAESCHKFCGKNDDCKWGTWEPSNSLCSLFANCTDPKHSTGHPDAGPCADCISGQQACPARECHSPNKCQGHVVEGPISNKATHLEDCINICKDTVDCEYYTYEKKDDHCMLFKDCNSTISCDTCATGKKYCSNGYHGDDEAVAEAPASVSWVCDFDWTKTYWVGASPYMPLTQNINYNLGEIWGPLGPGTGQNSGACYKPCRYSNDANGNAKSDICAKTYNWYLTGG